MFLERVRNVDVRIYCKQFPFRRNAANIKSNHWLFGGRKIDL